MPDGPYASHFPQCHHIAGLPPSGPCPLQVTRSQAAKALLLTALAGATAATWLIALVIIRT